MIFKNFIGVAAGFDKNAEVINKIHFLNFGFTEVGTITPMPQYGNPKPRIFRLEKDRAIINRNGFNNLGMLQARKKLEDYRKKFPVGSNFVVGVNIGPNKDSKDRFNDYKVLAKNLSKFADYISINVSSPNTPNLREFQKKENLEKVINFVKDGIATSKTFNKKLPIFLLLNFPYPQCRKISGVRANQFLFDLIPENYQVAVCLDAARQSRPDEVFLSDSGNAQKPVGFPFFFHVLKLCQGGFLPLVTYLSPLFHQS